jgi:hypothetical protein
MMQRIKTLVEFFAVIMLILSSAAVTIGVTVYLLNQQPFAHKSDIAKVEQTATTALATTQKEEKRQDAASALVKTAVGSHGEKIKGANDRIGQLERDVGVLKKRVGALDGSDLFTSPPAVKHAAKH